ncbi:MAG TPA: hypothetical protein VGG32_06860 [Thermoplasmata archaeon]|jgi:hypothetical protein
MKFEEITATEARRRNLCLTPSPYDDRRTIGSLMPRYCGKPKGHLKVEVRMNFVTGEPQPVIVSPHRYNIRIVDESPRKE